jgi:hypothetical protein
MVEAGEWNVEEGSPEQLRKKVAEPSANRVEPRAIARPYAYGRKHGDGRFSIFMASLQNRKGDICEHTGNDFDAAKALVGLRLYFNAGVRC